jgi:precorrin-2 dehydrogenase / sirohydrochlorin ferrochelatase
VTALDFPVALRLEGRPVLVVGAGHVAERRVLQLLEVGARVHLVSPEATPELQRRAARQELRLTVRPYRRGDVGDAFVVFAASNDPAVNRAVIAEARARRVLANAADMPELCDFHLPAIGRRGPIVLAVSTSGEAPGLSRVLRDRLVQHLTDHDGRVASLIGRLRRLWPPGPSRTRALDALASAAETSVALKTALVQETPDIEGAAAQWLQHLRQTPPLTPPGVSQ